MLELFGLIGLGVLLLGVLYGALGHDERDNMTGGCKAAAMCALNDKESS